MSDIFTEDGKVNLRVVNDIHILADYFRNAPKAVKRAAKRIGDEKLSDAMDMFLLNKQFDGPIV